MPKRLIKDYTRDDLRRVISEYGFEKFRADQIFEEIYVKRTDNFMDMSLIPAKLREFLDSDFRISAFEDSIIRKSKDGSVKFLFKMLDGNSIEAVYMPWESDSGDKLERVTLCISSMAGCPVGCSFCATGTLGFQKNLTPGEIVDQILVVEKLLGEKITNIVYMGMGEPLLNYKHVVNSLDILTDEKSNLLRRKRITLSTSGIPDKINLLAGINKPVKLAISLHATTNGVREKIMSVAKAHTLSKLMDSVEYYYRTSKMNVTYEYILFEGLNDTEEDIKRLSKIAKRVPSRVNIIPYNDISFTNPTGFAKELKPVSREKMHEFANKVRKLGAVVIVRDTFGSDIEAACGQLALSEKS